ncbi:MAG: helix-turn-helix domain-containing protein [Clostridia bacterium]|nr:helix-turn-helix domain-containing protein [Clostridia bacterium]
MASFGERLKLLREEKGKTQQEIAELLGLSRSALSKYEHNDREPDRQAVAMLTDYFDVSVDYLFGRTNVRNHYSQNDKVEQLMKDKNFLGLVTKIIENDLDIEAIEKMIDNALLIKKITNN